MALLWLRLRQQGLEKYLFCSGMVDTDEKFKEVLLHPEGWTYAGFSWETGEPVALAIFDSMQGKTVRLHYTFFRNEESKAHMKEYAEAFFDLIFENRTVDCILMLTPRQFRHSNAFAKSIGAVHLGSIPSIVPVKNFKTGVVTFGPTELYRLDSPHLNQRM